MKNKTLIWILQFLISIPVSSQTLIIIEKLPSNTRTTDTLYAAGTFNEWDPHDLSYRFQLVNGHYQVKIPGIDRFAFKCTRGSWESVEVDIRNRDIQNRVFEPEKSHDTLWISIMNWKPVKPQAKPEITLSKGLQIRAFTSRILNTQKKVRIYLPSDYSRSRKSYPVLYLLDGQNIFSGSNATGAGSWEVDRSMSHLQQAGGYGCIVVAVDHAGVNRVKEYSAFPNNASNGTDGKRFAAFLALELKPAIDSLFRTLKTREFTGVGGSSLGANMALFSVLTYPGIYSKALIFSPAIWFNDSLRILAKKNIPAFPVRFVMMCGKREGGKERFGQDMQAVANLLRTHPQNSVFDTLIYDGEHSEWFWKREFIRSFEKLYGRWTPVHSNELYPVFAASTLVSQAFRAIPGDSARIFIQDNNNRYLMPEVERDRDTSGYFYSVSYPRWSKINATVYFIYAEDVRYLKLRRTSFYLGSMWKQSLVKLSRIRAAFSFSSSKPI